MLGFIVMMSLDVGLGWGNCCSASTSSSSALPPPSALDDCLWSILMTYDVVGCCYFRYCVVHGWFDFTRIMCLALSHLFLCNKEGERGVVGVGGEGVGGRGYGLLHLAGVYARGLNCFTGFLERYRRFLPNIESWARMFCSLETVVFWGVSLLRTQNTLLRNACVFDLDMLVMYVCDEEQPEFLYSTLNNHKKMLNSTKGVYTTRKFFVMFFSEFNH